MYCYRRGFSISQVAYPCKKLINGQKSDKMRHSYSCQSRIIYKENSSGAVNVIDDSTHYSHSDKISLLNLTKKERAVISGKYHLTVIKYYYKL